MYIIPIITIAVVLTVCSLLMKKIEIEDKNNGLELNSEAYTIHGTLRNMFRSPEKRLKRETTMTFSQFMKDRTRARSMLLPTGIASMLSVAGAVIGIFTRTDAIVPCIFAFAMNILTGIANSRLIPILSAACLVFIMLLSIDPLLLLPIIGIIVQIVVLISLRNHYKKAIKNS